MNQVAVVNTGRISPIRAFAEEGNAGVLGKSVDFKKGQWYVDDQPVDDGALLTIDMMGGYRCVIKWFDKHPVEGSFQLASIANNELLPSRNELGDLDDSKWEEGLDGKPRDPWNYGHRQIMVDEKHKPCTFRTSSFGGKRAMQLLYGAYDREKDQHPGLYPIIALSQEKVRNKTFGIIPEPRFPIVGWGTLDGSPPPMIEATPDDPRTQVRDALNDSIPF